MRLGLRGFFAIAIPLASVACSGSGADVGGSSGTCGSGDRMLASGIDPNGTTLAVSGEHVYFHHEGGANSVFARVPLTGGATETISGSSIRTFDVNAAGTLAWTDAASPSGSGALHVRDAAGTDQTLPLPDGALSFGSLAVDGAGNVFVVTDASIPPTNGGGGPALAGAAVWRWSAVRKAYDLLHRIVGDISGFMRDGDGIAWVAPTPTGQALYREDVAGGTPAIGPQVPDGATVIGLDATKLYVMRSPESIQSVDRTTGAIADEVRITVSQPERLNEVVADGGHFYWLVHDKTAGNASIFRVDSGGTPEVFATSSDLELLAVGGCSVAYLGVGSDGGAWGIMTRPR